MTIKLPVMNHLVQRWNLPAHIIEQCDFYKVQKVTQRELFQVMCIRHTDLCHVLHMHGIEFEVIYQNGAPTAGAEHYWLSYRSMTFEFQGTVVTRSYVLVQPDKARQAEKVARHVEHTITMTNTIKPWRSFAELSQPKESNDD